MKTSARTAMGAAAAALALALSACTDSPSTDAAGGGDKDLEVFSWWTSGSESKALDVLFDAFAKESGLGYVNAAVSGGGGSNAQQVLATRLQGGDPPDSWQLHPDQDLAAAVQDGSVADISALFADNGWADLLPSDIDQMLQVDGKYYAVPVGAHRGNVLWTNPALLDKAGITWDETTTPDQFMDDVRALAADGVTPLCVGDKDIFASSQLLESLIMARVGAQGWNDLMDGTLSFDDAKVTQAVDDFIEILSLANPDHATLTWDQAALAVPDGTCAANLMGDWAYGELKNKGFEEDSDFAAVAMPGTATTFDLISDAFVKPAKDAPNPEAEDTWLKVLLDKQVQLDFSLAKGSAPIRTDVDLSQLPPYQQHAAQALRTADVVSSLAHRQGAPAEFAQAYADAVTALTGGGDAQAFTTAMAQAQATILAQ